MMKRKALLTLMAASMLTIGGGTLIHAAFDENLNMYTLDAVVVEADKTKNKFGDTITEQSYYRTGGDVKVITREEIEKRHYTDVTDAIKRIPGVTFSNSGYRGGEYGYNSYNNSMSINGDSRVIVLVDGRRVDNATSTRFGSSNYSGTRTMVDLNEVVNVANIEKIEVIKGPGASVYGADATGGAINIITRKGGDTNVGTVDVSTGSWKKHVYNVSYSGSAGNDKSWKYFISANRNMAGDSKYKDGQTGRNETYRNTDYKEDSVNLRLDKEFNEKRNLKIWYNHQNGDDGYPIAAPDYTHWTTEEFQNIWGKPGSGAMNKPGYRNWYVLDALDGARNLYKHNDLDISYTYNKDNGMESFVRVYKQDHKYWGARKWQRGFDERTDWPDMPLPFTPEWDEFIKTHPYTPATADVSSNTERNRGIQLQYGKSVGKHDILGAVTFDKAKTHTVSRDWRTGDIKQSDVKRDSVLGFIQDKIHITDKWDLTPAVRYSHYSTFSNVNDNGTTTVGNSSNTVYTPALNTEYAFDDTFSMYFGWTKVHRPIKSSDYSATTLNGIPLEDEKGNVWTFGVRKDLSDHTSIAAHYDWTDMSNAVTGYPYWNEKKQRFDSKAVNAKETKKSFNVTLDHQFNDKWSMSLAYSHLKDEWKAKDGMDFDLDLGLNEFSNVNTMINSLRPQNHYTANFSYDCNKWYTGLLINWYTGCNTTAFTDSSFLVLDWNLNYEINKELTAYVSVSNLTNEAYQNTFNAWNGIGSAPQPGRAWMVGAKYKF